MQARSTLDPSIVVDLNRPSLRIGDKCPLGSQLRPHIVWFGEEVPLLPEAISLVMKADILVIVGTSLNVYPAAGLIHYAPDECKVFLVDPHEVPIMRTNVVHIKKTASTGVPELAAELIVEG